jgi:hypothetical protein
LFHTEEGMRATPKKLEQSDFAFYQPTTRSEYDLYRGHAAQCATCTPRARSWIEEGAHRVLNLFGYDRANAAHRESVHAITFRTGFVRLAHIV